MAEKSANNLLAGIEKSKEKPFSKALYGLGIRYVGETVAKRLAQAFGSMDALRAASVKELIATEEIGERIAQSVVEYLADPINEMVINALTACGVQMEEQREERDYHDAFKGKRFVVSGVFEQYSRSNIKSEIERLGGLVVGSVSSKTDFLVAGTGIGPAKEAKAKALNISILSEDEFNLLKKNRE